jgi:hypothetical protein
VYVYVCVVLRCGKAVGVASVSPHHHPDDDPPPLQDEAARYTTHNHHTPPRPIILKACKTLIPLLQLCVVVLRLCALLPFPMNPGVAASFLQRRKASDAHLSPYAHLPLQVLAPTSSEGPASPQALDDDCSLKHALASRYHHTTLSHHTATRPCRAEPLCVASLSLCGCARCDWSRACVPVPLLAAAALTLTSPHRPRSRPPLCPAPPSMLTLSHAPGLGCTLTISSSVAPAPVLTKAPANPFLLHRYTTHHTQRGLDIQDSALD